MRVMTLAGYRALSFGKVFTVAGDQKDAELRWIGWAALRPSVEYYSTHRE
jgi:hypothetical protein